MLAAGGAALLGGALRPPLAARRPRRRQNRARHHRLRPYRRHNRRPVGQGRPSVRSSSRHPEELKDLVAARTAGPGRHRDDRPSRSATLSSSPCPRRDAAARPGLRRQLKGKIVLDACNAVPRATAPSPTRSSRRHRRDLAEISAGTRLVRAFNTLSYMIFVREANRPDPKLAVPIAGDDPEAVQVAAGLVRDAGFEPVVVGKLADAAVPARRARLRPAGDRGRTQAEAVAGAMTAAPALAAAGRCRRRRRNARRRCGPSPISSRCSPAITCCGRCATRWALPAASRTCRGCSPRPSSRLLVAQPLYGALVARLPRARFIPVVYHFFVANLALFWLLLTLGVATGRSWRACSSSGSACSTCSRSRCSGRSWPTSSQRAGQAPVRLHRRRRHGRRAARPGHHHRPFGAARPGQSPDRRRRAAGSWRCSASIGSSARARCSRARARDADAAARRRQRLRGAVRADPLALSARRRRLGQPAVVRRDDPLFRAGQHRRGDRPRRRRADAHLRRHRPRGGPADAWRRRCSPPAGCSSVSAPASRRRAAGGLHRGLRGAGAGADASPSWWSSRWCSAG